jgi:hypothetical protein
MFMTSARHCRCSIILREEAITVRCFRDDPYLPFQKSAKFSILFEKSPLPFHFSFEHSTEGEQFVPVLLAKGIGLVLVVGTGLLVLRHMSPFPLVESCIMCLGNAVSAARVRLVLGIGLLLDASFLFGELVLVRLASRFHDPGGILVVMPTYGVVGVGIGA